MNLNLWAKTCLTVYRYLDRLAEAIDGLVDRQALNSYYSNFTNYSVMDIADKIIELSERKVKLINLKVLIEKTLENLDVLDSRILIEKYIHNDKGEEIAKRNNLSLRTYFRKQNSAENAFTAFMASKGFSEEKLSKYLAGESWIMEVYKKFQIESGISEEELTLDERAI